MVVEVLKILKDFGNQRDYLVFLEQTRWGDKRSCPYCNSVGVKKEKQTTRRNYRWRCLACRKPYSVLVNTVFHRSVLPMKAWFDIIYFMFSSKKRLGCRAISKLTGIPHNTVWIVQKRIRAEMRSEKPGLLKKIIGWTGKDYNIFIED